MGYIPKPLTSSIAIPLNEQETYNQKADMRTGDVNISEVELDDDGVPTTSSQSLNVRDTSTRIYS